MLHEARHGYRSEKHVARKCVSFHSQQEVWVTRNAHRQIKRKCSGGVTPEEMERRLGMFGQKAGLKDSSMSLDKGKKGKENNPEEGQVSLSYMRQ